MKNKPDISDLKIDPEMRSSGSRLKPLLIVLCIIALMGGISYIAMYLVNRPVEALIYVVRESQPNQQVTVLNGSGYVVPRRKATVAPRIRGQVVEILVEEGMPVKEGQVLARLDDRESIARLKSAKADLAVFHARIRELEVALADARKEYERTKLLFKENIATLESMDDSKTLMDKCEAQLNCAYEEIRAADARVEVASSDLDNYTIQAPFSGIVISINAQKGEIVAPGSAGGGFTRTGITTIVDMDSLEIEVDVNENYISNIYVGQKALAKLDAYPDWEIPTTVQTTIPAADRQRATVKVRLNIDKPDKRILPDMGVNVAFMTDSVQVDNNSPVINIPKRALHEFDGKYCVYALDGEYTERRIVKEGKTIGDNIEILEGLKHGDRIVIEGPENIKDGQKIRER